jgi:hypothetical protein
MGKGQVAAARRVVAVVASLLLLSTSHAPAAEPGRTVYTWDKEKRVIRAEDHHGGAGMPLWHEHYEALVSARATECVYTRVPVYRAAPDGTRSVARLDVKRECQPPPRHKKM